MNDNRSLPDAPRDFSPLIGFALGAVIGGGLALLLAPASGARTRRRIGEAARQLGSDAQRSMDSARHTLDEARESVTTAATGLGTDVKAAIDAGREAFRHDGKPQDLRGASRVAQVLDTPPTPKP